MKFLKAFLLILGIIGLAVGGYYLFQSWLEVRNLWAMANANRSQASVNPTNMVLLSAGAGSLGGLLLGLGLGLPGRTAGGIRKATLQEVATKRESEIRDRARHNSGDAGRAVDSRRDSDRALDRNDRLDDSVRDADRRRSDGGEGIR